MFSILYVTAQVLYVIQRPFIGSAILWDLTFPSLVCSETTSGLTFALDWMGNDLCSLLYHIMGSALK